jgi:HAD superfamily hydrolase (TIGR01509 family)
MLRGILWDSDGVLADSEQVFFESNRDYFRRHGLDLTEELFFDWFLAQDLGAWHVLERRGVSAAEVAACREDRNALFVERLRARGDLLDPAMARLLARLHRRVAMGVVTGSSREHFDVIHGDLGLTRYFDFVLTAESYRSAKPSPEPYLLGLQRLGLGAEDCLAVEDSPRGLAAARAAGIRCIALRTPLTRGFEFPGAYRVVDSVARLGAEIEALL